MNIKMLKRLDFGSLIANTKPVTESGREMIKNYAGYLFSNECNYSLVNNFINEAHKYSYDSGIMETLSKVAEFVKDNQISWKLASVCENLCTARPGYDMISKNAISQVDKLLETLNESQIKQYIKAGALKNIQYIPEFRQICKSVYSQTITEAQTASYNMITPICYAEQKGQTHYMQVAGRTYKTYNGTIMESEAPSNKFIIMNNLLSNMVRTENNDLVYVYENRNIKFTINENGIQVDKNNNTQKFTESKDFDQWRDMVSCGIMGVNAKTEFMRITENLRQIYENFDNFVVCDNVRVFNTSNGHSFTIIEGKNNIIVNSFNNNINGYKSYRTIMEALTDIEKNTHVNLQPVYETRINNDVKSNADKEHAEELQMLRESKVNERRRRIERLTEQYKNNPVKLAVLNKLAKEISNI